ncbi:trehalase 1 [Actinidia rufa]|uniref:Trehalase n=1 Tax=Actinidia rufa TaxID=165716 RepID=A0A7J0DZC8_9ERIC|nr:trehalase 1 [Actinidia rufa]
MSSLTSSKNSICSPTDSGPVVPTNQLLTFLQQLQETALETFGDKQFDPKLYVDLSLKSNLSSTREAFEKLPRSNDGTVSTSDLNRFLEDYLNGAEEDLVYAEPSDFVPEPEGFLPAVESAVVRGWALEVHSLWRNLSRRVAGMVVKQPELHTLLPLPKPVMIPGSRFREVYYWDSYWVIRGLLASKMYETAKGIVKNLISLIDEFGYVLNGARTYYTNRSQPPLLSAMIRDIYDRTGDMEFARKSLPALLKEHKFWNSGVHSVTILDAKGCNRTLSRHYAMWNKPRPESSTIDQETASKLSSDSEKKHLYRELASTAETGWDFQYKVDEEFFGSHNIGNDIHPTGRFKCIHTQAFLANVTGDCATSAHFLEAAEARKEAMNAVFWNEEMGQWLDYWLSKGTQCKDDYTWRASNQNRNIFASNFIPLWIDLFNSDRKLVEKVMQGTFPNGWAPLQHAIVEGLVRSGSKEARSMAEDIAVSWIRTNHVAFKKSGAMHEKYDVQKCGEFGGGGEYVPQTGFGWSNGVVLAFLEEFGWPKHKKIDC